MRPDGQTETSLPLSVQEGLDQFCTDLRAALGDHLVAVILYGATATGEYSPSSSDVNVMVVLDEVTVELLDAAVPSVQQGRRDVSLGLMLLSENDLRCSTDVFPIKFLEMQQHHRVLWGKDLLADLPIATD